MIRLTPQNPDSPIGSQLSQALLKDFEKADHYRKARESFPRFVQTVGKDEESKALRSDDYTDLITQILPLCKDQGIHLSHVAPPGLGKSTLLRLFCLYELGRNPLNTIVFTSAVQSVAESSVSWTRQTFLRKAYRQTFPELKPDLERNKAGNSSGNPYSVRGWQKGKFFVQNSNAVDAAMEAVSATTQAESRRTSILVADDIITFEIANSAVKREKAIAAFFNTWLEGRLSNYGWAAMLQNCWVNTDLAHIIRHDNRVCSLWVGVTEDLQNLFARLWHPPEGLEVRESWTEVQPNDGADLEFLLPMPATTKYEYEELRKIETNQPHIFRRAYRLKALTTNDMMFPDFQSRTSSGETVSEQLKVEEVGGLCQFGPMDQLRFAFAGGLDLSSGKRQGDALWFLAKNRNYEIFPVEFWLGSYDVAKLVHLINEAWERGIKFGALYVENNGVQEKILESIKILGREANYEWVGRILPFTTGRQKADPEFGLEAVNTQFRTGYIKWPTKESQRELNHATMWKSCENSFMECPRFLEPGKSPDSIMAFWFAYRALESCSPSGARGKTRGIESDLRYAVQMM